MRSYGQVASGIRVPLADEEPFYFSISKIEKYMLYYLKRFLQWAVITTAKYWFIMTTKIKKFIFIRFPKLFNIFKKKEQNTEIKPNNTFLKRAIRESKIKIKKIREHVRAEHDMPN